MDRGEDPREIERAKVAEKAAQVAEATALAVAVGDLWPTYLTEGKPKRRDEWKPRYPLDLQRMASPGGQKKLRGEGARALLMFRGFMRWCATKPEYRGLVNAEAGKAPALLESLPSMKRRTDALEAAQVMGHKPSATAEGYRPRCVDALRPFLAQIEAHVLGLAGVQFDDKAEPGKLQLVAR